MSDMQKCDCTLLEDHALCQSSVETETGIYKNATCPYITIEGLRAQLLESAECNRKSSCINYNLATELDELKKELEAERADRSCKKCGGSGQTAICSTYTGLAGPSFMTCSECDGTGKDAGE